MLQNIMLQLVSNFIHLSFGTQQVAYSGVFQWKQSYESFETELQQESCRLKTKTMSWETELNYFIKLKKTAEPGHNPLWICHYKQPLPLISSPVIYC